MDIEIIRKIFSDASLANIISFLALFLSLVQFICIKIKEYKDEKEKMSLKAKDDKERLYRCIEQDLESAISLWINKNPLVQFKAEKLSNSIGEYCKKYALEYRSIFSFYTPIYLTISNDGNDDLLSEREIALQSNELLQKLK